MSSPARGPRRSRSSTTRTVTLAQIVKARAEVRAVGRGSRSGILEDSLATGLAQRVELAVEDSAPFGGGDTGVPDETQVGTVPKSPSPSNLLVNSFARVSAAVALRVADYYAHGPRSFFRLHERGGRYNIVPAHHMAQEYVDAYLEAARIGEDRRGPLFRSAEPGRHDVPQARGMSRVGTFKMIKRRAGKAGATGRELRA